VDQVQEVGTEDMEDNRTQPITLREVLITATREAEEESDEVHLLWHREGFINLLLRISCLMYSCDVRAKFDIATFCLQEDLINNRHPFHDCVFSESLQEDHTALHSRLQEEQSLDIRQVVQHMERPCA
jgi:hypothetical protein